MLRHKNRIRDGEEQKEGGTGGTPHHEKKHEEEKTSGEDSVNNVPQPANPNLLADDEHEIDLRA